MNHPRISEYRFIEAGNQVEGNLKVWVADASTLGFAPGVWPEQFAVVPVVGEDIVFKKVRQLENGGWRYEHASGSAIEVLND